jgi:hypothetical protein
MTPQLKEAAYIRDYLIKLTFADGVEGVVDLKDELWGEVFEPLKKHELFRAFRLNAELNTIEWPTGADLAPEYLYGQAAASKLN